MESEIKELKIQKVHLNTRISHLSDMIVNSIKELQIEQELSVKQPEVAQGYAIFYKEAVKKQKSTQERKRASSAYTT